MSKRSKRMLSLRLGAGLVLSTPRRWPGAGINTKRAPITGFESYSPGYGIRRVRPPAGVSADLSPGLPSLLLWLPASVPLAWLWLLSQLPGLSLLSPPWNIRP